MPTQLWGQCDASFTWTTGTCSDDPVVFSSNANPADVDTYTWTFGDGNGSNQANPTHNYDFAPNGATYTVTLTVTLDDSAGTTCSTTQSVVVPGGPLIQVSVDSLFKCEQNSPDTLFNPTFTINAASAGLGPFTWNFGNGQTVTSNALTQSPLFDCFGTYTVTVTAAGSSCPGYQQDIRFYTNPVTDIVIDGPPVVCEGSSICVANNTNPRCGNVDYYEWDWGFYGDDYVVFDTATQCYVFDLDLTGNPTTNGLNGSVSITAFNGCFSHNSTTQITIEPGPNAAFTGPDTLCMPLPEATFNNFTTPDHNYIFDPTQYVWDFGDGSPLDTGTVNPIHNYASAGPGVYTVTLLASNGCGVSVATREVVVVDLPIAQLIPDTTQGCAPVCIAFDNLSTPDTLAANMSWTWDVISDSAWTFDAGSGANDFAPTICFNAPDSFLVLLTAENFCGADTDTVGLSINISPVITLDTIADTCGLFILDSLAYSLEDFGSPISSYSWTTTGVPGTATGQVLPPVDFPAGNHSITLSVVNECGITSASSGFVVDAEPLLALGPDTTLCINDSGPIFTANLTPGFWTGTGVDSAGKFLPPSLGSFSLIYTHQATRCLAYDTLVVTVVDTPAVTARADTAFCIDSSVVVSLTATPTGGTWVGPNVFNDSLFRGDTAGTFVFSYFYSDSTGCAGRDEVVITVHPLPTVNIADSSVFFCLTPDPQPLPSTVTPPGGTWSGPGVSNGNPGQFTPSLLGGPDTVVVFYAFTSPEGCFDVDSLVVEVISADSTFAGPGDSLCYNAGQDTLVGFFPNGGVWSGPGILGGTNIFDPLLMTPGSNELIYTFAPGTSCEASDTAEVFIRDTVALDIGPGSSLCEDALPFTLTANVPGGTWSGVGVIDAITGNYDPATVPPGLTDTVAYTLANANGCVSRDESPILVDSLPTASFLPPANTCIGNTVSFSHNSIYANSFQWDFGDGTSSPLPSPNHVYTVADTYEVCLTVFSPNFCEDTYCDTIIVSEPPTASFVQDVDSGCARLEVLFTDQSNAAGGSYFWDFGDGQTDTTANPGTITYEGGVSDTIYTVTLTIQNGCATVSQSSTVKVFPLPNLVFGPAVNSGCSVFPMDFANVSTGGPNTYAWYNATFDPDSLFSTDSVPPTQFYSYPLDTGFAEFEVYLIATNTCGSDTGSQTVTVFPNTVDAFFNANPIEGCEPLTVQFTDLSGAPFTGWDIEGSNPPTRTPSYTFTTPGTYEVLHFANNGCSFDTNAVTITVRARPSVSFDVDTSVICQGSSVSFTNTSLGVNGAQWFFGDGNGTTLPNPTHTYFTSGTFEASLIAFSDTNSCPDTATRIIEVRPEPPISFTLSDTAGCPPLTVLADGSASGANGYLWDFGDGSGPSVGATANHTYTQPGTYNLSLTVTDLIGCTHDSAAQIRVHPVPTAGFALSADTLCGASTPVVFTTQAAPLPLQHQWIIDDGQGFTDTLTSVDPSYVFPGPGQYTITQTVTNGFGCEAVATDELVILPQPQAQIGASDTADCVPFAVAFSDLSTGSSSRVWEIDGQSFFGANETYTFLTGDTTYQVILIADTADYCFDRDTVEIQTAEPPIADFGVSGYEFCFDSAGTAVSFTDQSVAGVPLSYAWNFGDGNLDSVANPTHLYLATGHYAVSLTVTHPFGCTDVFTDSVFVYPQPQAQISADTTEGCVPFAVNFTDLSIGHSATVWYIGDDTLQSVPGGSVSYNFLTPDTTFVVVIEVDTADFCFDTDTILIRTASLPMADFSLDQTQHCDTPATVQFTDQSSASLPLSYAWDFGDGNGSTQASPSHPFTSIDSFFVSLTVSNPYGCTDEHSDTVVVYPQPQAQIGADTTQGCVPLTVNFSDLSTGNSVRQWLIDGDTLSVANLSYTFVVPDTTYEIVLLVDTAGQCFDVDTLLIETASLPQAAFTVDNDQFCDAPATVSFTNQSTATLPITYAWDFGDGDTDVVTSPNHVYQTVAHHPVTLVATNSLGCTDTAQDTIFVYPQPVAEVAADTTRGCVPFDVNFTDLSTDASGWQWVIDGDTVLTQNLSYTFLQPDTSYVVELRVDTADFCFDQTSVQIEVASPPVADFGLSWDEICGVPARQELTNASLSTRPLTYQWTFGDGSGSVVPNPTKVYNQAGPYVIALAIANDYGCRDTLTDTVNIYPEPEASLKVQPERGCAPLDVQFTNLSTGYSNSRWDFGDGTGLSTQTGPQHTYFAVDTSFLVRLEVDTAGFCFDDTTFTVRVGSAPVADFEASLYEHCGPTTVEFTNQSFTANLSLSYQWDFGNGERSSLANPIIRYDEPGDYEVKLITRNSYGCADSMTRLIEIIPQPEVMFVVDDPEGCEAFTVQFTDLSQNVNGWQWDFGDGRASNDQNPTHTYVNVGLYGVSLIADYDGRCFDTLTQAEMVLVQPSPIADFRYEDSLREEQNDGTIKFINLTQNGQNFRWDLGDGTISNDLNPVHRYTVNDSFRVTLVAQLGECFDSTSQWIEPFYFGNLHVPNAFAPLAGGPGEYTKFFPKGIGLEEYRIAVYSTWGDLVWESTALEEGVPSEWWDGTINGRLVTQDVFVWKVHQARFVGGREWSGPREGSITVIK